MAVLHWTRAARITLLLGLLVASGCSRVRPGSNESGSATISFVNESLAQAEVIAVLPTGGNRKLATVMAGRTETIRVPSDIAGRGAFRIVARLLARSRTPDTGSITINPGQHLQVRLPLDERALFVLPGNGTG